MKLNVFNREVCYFIKYLLISRKRLLNFFLCKISELFRLKKVLGLPITVTIEPTNICNLKCPLCPTGQGLLRREKGYLSFENAKKVIDEISDYAVHLRLFAAGEPLLNKDLFKILEYAKEKICL